MFSPIFFLKKKILKKIQINIDGTNINCKSKNLPLKKIIRNTRIKISIIQAITHKIKGLKKKVLEFFNNDLKDFTFKKNNNTVINNIIITNFSVKPDPLVCISKRDMLRFKLEKLFLSQIENIVWLPSSGNLHNNGWKKTIFRRIITVLVTYFGIRDQIVIVYW